MPAKSIQNAITIFTIVLLVLGINTCNAQDIKILTTESTDSTNIYYYSLQHLLKNIEQSLENLKKEDTASYSDANHYFSSLYMLQSDLTLNFHEEFKNPRVLFLKDENALKEIIKERGKQKLLRIIPLSKNNDFFIINILLFSCYIDNEVLGFAQITGSSFQFKFDCSINNFIPIVSFD